MFRDRLAAVMQRLADELGPSATIDRRGTRWYIQPTHPGASPLRIAADNAGTLTVGFGRTSALINLGHLSKITPDGHISKATADEELSGLETICRAVIAGRLVERRKGWDGSRWQLTLDNGNSLDGWAGWAGWLWRALPWVRVDEEHFVAYTDPPRQSDASDSP